MAAINAIYMCICACMAIFVRMSVVLGFSFKARTEFR